ncbi:MAG: tail fiber protein [Oscillospiraceae bacterium]|nr:tail fiber protein [Oscillospiraceae bacterium]
MDEFIGTIVAWPVAWAPQGWALCQGQTLNIAQYQALYSILGNIYGGDGRTTFKLPNLAGRVIVGVGQSDGTSNYQLGQTGGMETVVLSANQMPAHAHSIPASTNQASTNRPGGTAVLAKAENAGTGDECNVYKTGAADTAMAPTGSTGQNNAHPNIQPYLALNYIICLEGIYPPRP